MSDKPLEVLPWGRDLAGQERLDRKKAAGRRGGFGCLFMAFAIVLVMVYFWGVAEGRYSKPSVNESPVSVARHKAEMTK